MNNYKRFISSIIVLTKYFFLPRNDIIECSHIENEKIITTNQSVTMSKKKPTSVEI